MNLYVRKMPGTTDVFRVQFHTSPSESPQVLTLSGADQRDLERFLINRLDQPASTVARVVNETIANGSAFIERLNFPPDEIRLLLKTVEQEQRAAETARKGNTMKHEMTT